MSSAPQSTYPATNWDVITFGETMLRLSPPSYARLEEATLLEVRIGGAESNVAVALARLGLRVCWWSRLPANALGRRIESEIRRWGVDTSAVQWEESPSARAGLYFLDFGVPPRPIEVTYDRAHSCASTIAPHHVDALHIAHSRLLHLTGITPALSSSCAEAVAHAIATAKRAGTRISFDTNYRARLWPKEKAKEVLEPLLPQVNLLLMPQEDGQQLFGFSEGGLALAQALRARYGVECAVVTCGGEGAFASSANGDLLAAPYPIPQVVDRVGAGDAFDAGVIKGYLQGDLALGLQMGMAMAALKHTIPGDLLLCTREEIEALLREKQPSIRR